MTPVLMGNKWISLVVHTQGIGKLCKLRKKLPDSVLGTESHTWAMVNLSKISISGKQENSLLLLILKC